jgi:hypothetical protein
MPKTTFKKFIRARHAQAPFRKRHVHISEVQKALRGELLTADEALIVSRKCRTCRDRTYKKGHLAGCNRSSCAWMIKPLVDPLPGRPTVVQCCRDLTIFSFLRDSRLAIPRMRLQSQLKTRIW